MTGQKEQVNRSTAGAGVSPNAVQGSLDRGRILIKSNYQLQQQNNKQQQPISQQQSSTTGSQQPAAQNNASQQVTGTQSSSTSMPKQLKFKPRLNKPLSTSTTTAQNLTNLSNDQLTNNGQHQPNNSCLTNDFQLARSRSRTSSQTSHNMSKTHQTVVSSQANMSQTTSNTAAGMLKKQLRQSSDTKASRTSIQPSQGNNNNNNTNIGAASASIVSSSIVQQTQQQAISNTNSRATVASSKIKPKSVKRSSTTGTHQQKLLVQNSKNSNVNANNTGVSAQANVQAAGSSKTKTFRSNDERSSQNQSGSVEVKKARFPSTRDAKGSPNNVSSGGDQSQKANKSFQFGHHAPLMSCSSGGDSSQAAAATKHVSTTAFGRLRSTSGKNGPQIKITKAPEDVPINQAPMPASTRSKPSSQNQNSLLNENTYNLFSILQQQPATTVHEEQKKFTFPSSAMKGAVRDKRQGTLANAGSSSSTGGVNNNNSTHTNFLISSKREKPTLSTSNINGQMKEKTEKVYTSLASINKQAKQQQQIQQQQNVQKQNSLSAVEESISQQSSASNPTRLNLNQLLGGNQSNNTGSPSKLSNNNAQDQQQQPSRDDFEYRKMVDQVKEKQSELAQLLQKLQARERARDAERREQESELSCDRIKNQLKLLERKLSQFTTTNQKHVDVVAKLEKSGQGAYTQNSNNNNNDENNNAWNNNNCVGPNENRVRSVLNSLSEIQKSAKEYLNLNNEPFMSQISEGKNSLMTVDGQTQFTHSQIGRDSEILDTFRYQTFTNSKSKASLEGPGGTPDYADASIVSYSFLLTEELQQIISGENSQRNHYQMNKFQGLSQEEDFFIDENNEMITLDDIELEEAMNCSNSNKLTKENFILNDNQMDPDASIISIEKDLMIENRRQASTVIEQPQQCRLANMIQLDNNYIQEEYDEGNSDRFSSTNENDVIGGYQPNTSLKSTDSLQQKKQFQQYQQYQVDHQVAGPPISFKDNQLNAIAGSGGYMGGLGGLSSSASSGLKSTSTAGQKSGKQGFHHLISSSTQNGNHQNNGSKPQIISVNKAPSGTVMTHQTQNNSNMLNLQPSSQDQVNISHLINDLKDIKKLELIRQESGGSQQIKRVDPPRLKFVGKKNVNVQLNQPNQQKTAAVSNNNMIGTVSGGGGNQVQQNNSNPNHQQMSLLQQKTSFDKKIVPQVKAAVLAGNLVSTQKNEYEPYVASNHNVFSTKQRESEEGVVGNSLHIHANAKSETQSVVANKMNKSLAISLPQNAIRAGQNNYIGTNNSTTKNGDTKQPKMQLMIKTPTNAFQTSTSNGIQFNVFGSTSIQTVTNAACTSAGAGINDTSLTSGSSQKFSGKSIKISKNRFQSVLGPQSKSPEGRCSSDYQQQHKQIKRSNKQQQQHDSSKEEPSIQQFSSQNATNQSVSNSNNNTKTGAKETGAKDNQQQQFIVMTGGSGETTTVDLLFSKIRAQQQQQQQQQPSQTTQPQQQQQQQVLSQSALHKVATKAQQKSLERVHRSTSNENAPAAAGQLYHQQHMEQGSAGQQKVPATQTLRINIKGQQSAGNGVSGTNNGKDGLISPVPVQKLKTMKTRANKI